MGERWGEKGKTEGKKERRNERREERRVKERRGEKKEGRGGEKRKEENWRLLSSYHVALIDFLELASPLQLNSVTFSIPDTFH